MNKTDNKFMSFEDYLKEMHAQDYHGTDDDMPDAFDNWLVELQVDDLIGYGDKFIEDTISYNSK